MPGYSCDRKELLDRLHRIEGQVRGVQRMVGEDEYCLNILTQLNALIAASRSVGLALLDQHVRHCVREGIERGEGETKVEELVAAVARFAGR